MKFLLPFAAFVAVSIACVVSGCANHGQSTSPSTTLAGGSTLTESDAGKTFTCATGTSFRLVLASNPTTGYSWRARNAGDCVQAGKSTYVPDHHPPQMVGVGGKEIFPFKAVKAGETTLRLTYLRPWDSRDIGQQLAFKIIVR